jgi:outer membrane lipoprotein SlyB
MKNILVVSALALSLTACANMGTGQGVGTLGGAAAGGLLGSLVGGGTGRLVAVGAGTLIGALAGGTVGHSVDQQNANKRPYSYGANAGEDSAYNRGRADYEAEQQRLREERAYQRGRTGQ